MTAFIERGLHEKNKKVVRQMSSATPRVGARPFKTAGLCLNRFEQH